MDSELLPLAEYSGKYKVSISTLRRKIKADDVRYVFEDGKYFIYDEPMGTHQRKHRPSQDFDQTLMSAQQSILVERAPIMGSKPKKQVASPSKKSTQDFKVQTEIQFPRHEEALDFDKLSFEETPNALIAAVSKPATNEAELSAKIESMKFTAEIERSQEESVLATANKLLGELKRAYSQILQEKEEQIMHLKEEVSDLKTLVRVLETK